MKKEKKKICISEFMLDFINENVFKSIDKIFYIDEKVLFAVYDLARCYNEGAGKVYFYDSHYGYDRYIEYRVDEILFKRTKIFYETIDKITKNSDIIDYDNLNQRLNTQDKQNKDVINKDYLKLLMLIDEIMDPENEVFLEINKEKYLTELTKDLNATIEYLDTCSEKELNYSSGVFEELSEHFKSQKLIECVERNIMRFDNKEMQERLKTELEYMKAYM